MNRKERRATIKKSKGDPELGHVRCARAPPLGTQMTVVKTNLQAIAIAIHSTIQLMIFIAIKKKLLTGVAGDAHCGEH
jgi:hypothetical protein